MENSKFVERLSHIGESLGNNIYLQAISRGVMGILPIIIIGSFASLFMGLPIAQWQAFLKTSGLTGVLSAFVAGTTNVLGLYMTYGICKTLSNSLGIKAKITPILALVTYITLLPSNVTEEGMAFLSFDFLGTKGMIVGIIISVIVCHSYKFIIDRNLTIKMPEGTPTYVSDSFLALVPAFFVALVAMILKFAFALTSYGDAFNCLYSLLQIPLTALIGGSLFANVIITALSQLNWAVGVHPGYLTGLVGPLLFSLDGMNQGFFAQGKALPNIIGMAFNYITTTAVFYPAIAIAVLIFAKSERLKIVGKVAVAPAFFGISEPLIFGLPIVFNPFVLIPWVLGPMVNYVVAYMLTSAGIVARCAGVTVFNVPMIFTGIMNGNISIALMEIGLFIIDILLFMPFIKVLEKNYIVEENTK
ncbi:PTS sugar transporter subunit IIC [Thomasclavelia ramosa]|uniref:PTS sugar transporter subunit IIC n=1 Tax=Thomasclavelia ramosa TaxID=1547 RepID=UPI000E404DE9|nr:PTS transporter subunit EIIC [Thomasclavelia ramosa]RGC87877.1 PTS sugar transporter subunit IIC [Thomasclavelia ramosa]